MSLVICYKNFIKEGNMMSVKLDPNVKANLLNVLFNIQDKEKASIKMIGGVLHNPLEKKSQNSC